MLKAEERGGEGGGSEANVCLAASPSGWAPAFVVGAPASADRRRSGEEHLAAEAAADGGRGGAACDELPQPQSTRVTRGR